jgi:hypothetical protein
MIEDLIQDLVVKTKARTGASEELVLWAIVIAILSVIAVVFQSVAAYVWIANFYGGVIAGAAVGCFHVLLVTAALIRCIVIRHRTRELALAEIKVAAKKQAWWTDPGVLAVGLELAKIIGWRKLAPFVTAGVLAATMSGKRDRGADEKRAH